jgi:hypothetical protein
MCCGELDACILIRIKGSKAIISIKFHQNSKNENKFIQKGNSF